MCCVAGTAKREVETGNCEWTRVLMAANSVKVACAAQGLGQSKSKAKGKNNCQQTWKRDQRILRTISLYAATSAAAEQSARRACTTWRSVAFNRVLFASVCVCTVVPYLLFSLLPSARSPSRAYADQPRRQGKIQLGVACAAFGASEIIALCFLHSSVLRFTRTAPREVRIDSRLLHESCAL